MDDTGFDFLCQGLSPEEAKLLRKLNAEWSDGDEDSFLVQFALLTRAQWRAAASVPRSVNDSRKWLEQHLAEYRRQTAGLVDHFAIAIEDKNRQFNQELKTVIETQAKATQETMTAIRRQSVAAEYVANAFQQQVKTCVSEWKQATNKFAEERHKLEAMCQALSDRLEWLSFRCLVVMMVFSVIVGILIGDFWWKQ